MLFVRYLAPRPRRQLRCGEVIGVSGRGVRLAEWHPVLMNGKVRGHVYAVADALIASAIFAAVMAWWRPLGRDAHLLWSRYADDKLIPIAIVLGGCFAAWIGIGFIMVICEGVANSRQAGPETARSARGGRGTERGDSGRPADLLVGRLDSSLGRGGYPTDDGYSGRGTRADPQPSAAAPSRNSPAGRQADVLGYSGRRGRVRQRAAVRQPIGGYQGGWRIEAPSGGPPRVAMSGRRAGASASSRRRGADAASSGSSGRRTGDDRQPAAFLTPAVSPDLWHGGQPDPGREIAEPDVLVAAGSEQHLAPGLLGQVAEQASQVILLGASRRLESRLGSR